MLALEMTLVRHFALWLAAAIVMIAVSLMPSVASAHQGHASGHRYDAPNAVAAIGHTDRTAAATVGKAQDVEPHAAVGARLICTGPCCTAGGHVCSSCCATGLTPAAALTWHAPRPEGIGLARDVSRPPGIVPEALPEPPRPIA